MPLIVGTDPLALEEFPLDLPTRGYLGDSGIVLADGSVADDYGCRWKFAPTNAWGQKPGPREVTGDRPYAHGQWDATKYYGPRLMPIPGTVRAPTHAALHAAEQRLRDAVTVEPFTYRVTEPGFDSYATVRQQGTVDWTEDGTPAVPHATFLITLYAPDPLIYSMLERTFSIDFPLITGGLVWPATWPATWNSSGSTGQEILSNPARLPIGLTLRVDGPADSVSIGFPELGQALNLDNPAGDILAAGAYLLVDTTTRQVLLNGQANRRSWMYGDWLQLPPRSDTTLSIAGAGTGAGSQVSGSYRAARI